MKFGKALINIILIVIVILAAVVFMPLGKSHTSNFLKGYVDNPGNVSMKKYSESLIDYYDPQPNWKFGEEMGTANQPEIVASNAILIDSDTGRILYEKNSGDQVKIASLVKIMTAVVALEHKDLDQKIFISGNAASIGENSMGLTEGEVYTLEELLYGLMLNSGNDAAYAIAEGTAGDSDTFVQWMNIKAKELGLKKTRFADPSGLDDSTFSTAKDLARLTRYALKNPKFREIVKTVEIDIPGNDKHKYVPLYNQTNLLTTYPGVMGVKTGFTEEAGLCLVTYAANDGREVIGVVLNSIDRKGDMILMLDHGFRTLGVSVEHDLL